jgi:hypothetical protein
VLCRGKARSERHPLGGTRVAGAWWRELGGMRRRRLPPGGSLADPFSSGIHQSHGRQPPTRHSTRPLTQTAAPVLHSTLCGRCQVGDRVACGGGLAADAAHMRAASRFERAGGAGTLRVGHITQLSSTLCCPPPPPARSSWASGYARYGRPYALFVTR